MSLLFARLSRLTDARFCPEHARAEDTRYRKYQRDLKINRRYGRQ
ncbi:hypothetical protein [Dermabacter sp.]